MCSQKSVNKRGVLVLMLTFSGMNRCVGGLFPNELQFPQKIGEEDAIPKNIIHPGYHHTKPPQYHHPPPFQHAGLPRHLAAYPVPRQGSNRELQLNVTWLPPIGPRARDYSLEISSMTNTTDCDTMCYEYNIPGNTVWYLVPSVSSPVSDACAVRPGCAYRVRLIAHPWDGHTSANIVVHLDECVSGVCSCAHAPRLPAPAVSARTVSDGGGVAANVSWSLPPIDSRRLPKGLGKAYYVVSIGKQMVPDSHQSPWFANIASKRVPANGPLFTGSGPQWSLVHIGERSGERGGERGGKNNQLDVRLLARVYLLDDRGCAGPTGNATAYDRPMQSTTNFAAFATWAAFGGVCALAIVVILAVSTKAVKRVFKVFRSAPLTAPLTAPLESLGQRHAWLPMQLRTNNGPSARGQMEESPLYVPNEFETAPEGDEWEVRRSQVQLGALIGSGAFGRVHAATLQMPGDETMIVAAKMLSNEASEDEQQDFLREIAMLKHVGTHKHVIRLVGCCTTRAPLIALLEHAPRGDLLTLLRAARGRRKEAQGQESKRSDSSGSGGTHGRPSEADSEYTIISDGDPPLMDGKSCKESSPQPHYVAEPALRLDSSTMRDYALQVALGMKHLEARGITHRDLAARNILVDGSGVLKVADFGLSRSGVYVHTRARPVPLRWLAPEAILHSRYSSSTDVWAFAVLLWEIATLGGFPYAELSNEHVPSFLAGGRRLPRPARASTRLYRLMLDCWMRDPALRPTFAQIVDKLTAQTQLYVDLDLVLDEEPTDDSVFNSGDG